MSQDRSWKSGKKIQWILCWYENNGYVNWEVHDSRQSALLEGPHTNEDWCVVRYDTWTDNYSVVGYSGRTFPVNILKAPYASDVDLTIYSVPADKLGSTESHYNGFHSHVTPIKGKIETSID